MNDSTTAAGMIDKLRLERLKTAIAMHRPIAWRWNGGNPRAFTRAYPRDLRNNVVMLSDAPHGDGWYARLAEIEIEFIDE